MRRAKFPLFVIASAAALCGPADAQCRLCSAPSTGVLASPDSADVQLEIEASLNFDRLVLAQAGPGDATLRPDGSSSGTGSITSVGARARVATINVHGEPNRALRIDVPRRIDLFSLGGARLTFDQVVTDAADLPKLDSAGNLTIHIGGRLRFMGNEDGDYRGDLPITVEYL
jgi:Domain of unknown function (DUF4402)